ncbi:MAG: GntR family transcriptional regulator [Anaerolineaceae bacterium]|nr:GntR family transcriptional regulator [Anaerolineaceae bacterium]
MDTPLSSSTDLDIRPVDENSPIPLYQQVRIDLLNMLQSEQLKPGQMLPTEKELAEAYNVSRQTIRQAIGDLASSNLLERTPGRGTTVLSGRNRLKFFLDKSFAQQIVEMGLEPHSEVLRQKETVIDNASPQSLRHKRGSTALELIRVRFGNDTPIGMQYTTIITDLCPDLGSHDFKDASLYNLILTKYKLPIARIDQTIGAVIADEWHKNLLKVSREIPLLLVNTTAYLENGEPLEASTSYYRADKYEFSVSQNYW